MGRRPRHRAVGAGLNRRAAGIAQPDTIARFAVAGVVRAMMPAPRTQAHPAGQEVPSLPTRLSPRRQFQILFGLCLGVVPAMVLGTVVFVTYLQVADQFGCHTLEAFSGLRIEGWKSHLRLRVSADEVVVRVIGIDHAPSARNRDDLRAVVPVPHVVETFRVPWDGSAAADEIVRDVAPSAQA